MKNLKTSIAIFFGICFLYSELSSIELVFRPKKKKVSKEIVVESTEIRNLTTSEEVMSNIPLGGNLKPKEEVPVFAVASKQGMRVMVSWDDGKTWKQTFMGTKEREDGGWHGHWAVYGMAYTKGVIGVFAGWGKDGTYIGSEDGLNWQYMNKAPGKLPSVWGATAGKGIFMTSADPWRGVSTSSNYGADWQKHSLGSFTKNVKTHHITCAYGDYEGGRFVAIGDNQFVIYSEDLCKTWKQSSLPLDCIRHGTAVYGNDVFVVPCEKVVAISKDGGETWTSHAHGLKGRPAFQGLSYINGEFWLSSNNGGGRKSKDGVSWSDLPSSLPSGTFVQSETGTIINVGRNRDEIKRSTDGEVFETVFDGPAAKETMFNWSFSYAVYGKVKRPNLELYEKRLANK